MTFLAQKSRITFAATSLEAIARQANVSISTVSRALSGKAGVSSTKRAQIEAIADELGFAPDPYASSLRQGKSKGMTLITSVSGSAIARIRERALLSMSQTAFGSARIITRNETDKLDDLVRQAARQRCEAIIVSSDARGRPNCSPTNFKNRYCLARRL